jgi:hypothetical protein
MKMHSTDFTNRAVEKTVCFGPLDCVFSVLKDMNNNAIDQQETHLDHQSILDGSPSPGSQSMRDVASLHSIETPNNIDGAGISLTVKEICLRLGISKNEWHDISSVIRNCFLSFRCAQWLGPGQGWSTVPKKERERIYTAVCPFRDS